MSSDLASPSESSDRSHPTFGRPRNASKETGQTESGASGRKRFESSNPPLKQNFGSVLQRTPRGDRTSRNYNDEPESHDHHFSSTKVRTSGGFLLDVAGAPSRLAFMSRLKNDTSNVKGKSKRDGSGLILSKRRNRDAHRSSIGSSPLATKVSTIEDDEDVHAGSPGRDGSDPHRSMVSGSSNANDTTLQDESHIMGSATGPVPAGYDTDPMQIVNLALSLSEGRRRQISGMRLASGDSGIKRSISTGNGTNLRAVRPPSGLGQYLNSERQFSRNISPRALGHLQATPLNTPDAFLGTTGRYLQSFKIDDADSNYQDDLYDVSDATFARVKKAKDHFELFYEHRRLLAHLPPIRGSTQATRKLGLEGRAYNPLQYARNRKVRFQEKKPIESGIEGWQDVQQVHAWVNAIIEGHSERRTDPDECIRLPDLHHLHNEANQENANPVDVDSPSSTTGKREVNQSAKPRRPRLDWVVSPADLLADVYWLEQGLNKTKIEDRDGNKIYPWDTELKFTGWRNRTPAQEQGSQHTSHPSQSAESRKAAVPVPIPPPELPTFTSTGRKVKHRGRGRRREIKAQRVSESETSDSDSQKRRKWLRKRLIRPLSRSSTSDSDDEKSPGEETKAGREENEESAIENGVLDHYMRKMLDRDARPFSRADKPRSSMERSRSTTKGHHRHGSRTALSRERATSKKRGESHNRLESIRNSLDKRRQSRPSLDIERPARSSLDYETAPSSPSIHQFPSIAINLSPPPSRSPSPTKKGLHSRINPFRDRNQSKQRNGIDTADFANAPPSPLVQPRSNEMEGETNILDLGSRDTSPMTKYARRTSDPSVGHGESERSHSTVSKPSAKTLNTPDAGSRMRGMFKGGRIAELVGNEVSRVGDFIWKREPPSATRTSSSASSVKSQQGSDNEEEVRANGNVFKDPPQAHSGRFSSPTDGPGKKASPAQLRSAFGASDKTSYFMSNLPSFTSPFQRDREVQEERDRAALLTLKSSPPNTQGSDHISTAAAHHRSASRSSRLNRLAPPKLTISRSNSPSGSPEDHRGSYGFGRTLPFSGLPNASRGPNNALGRPPPVTGLTSLKASKSGTDLTRDWDPSARQDASTERSSALITKKDIARARALLLSSGTKARQISLQAHSTRSQPPPFLLNSLDWPSPPPETVTSLRVPRKDEHLLAARNLNSTLTTHSTSFRTSLDHFTCATSPALHTSLQALDDLVENTLTPRVRASADASGELFMKLTTTSTLAINGLNDVIEGLMRRRRRGPVRWLRRLGYGVVEWLVVGLLWGIWLVVSVFRGAIGGIRGSYKVLRWLLWLN